MPCCYAAIILIMPAIICLSMMILLLMMLIFSFFLIIIRHYWLMLVFIMMMPPFRCQLIAAMIIIDIIWCHYCFDLLYITLFSDAWCHSPHAMLMLIIDIDTLYLLMIIYLLLMLIDAAAAAMPFDIFFSTLMPFSLIFAASDVTAHWYLHYLIIAAAIIDAIFFLYYDTPAYCWCFPMPPFIIANIWWLSVVIIDWFYYFIIFARYAFFLFSITLCLRWCWCRWCRFSTMMIRHIYLPIIYTDIDDIIDYWWLFSPLMLMPYDTPLLIDDDFAITIVAYAMIAFDSRQLMPHAMSLRFRCRHFLSFDDFATPCRQLDTMMMMMMPFIDDDAITMLILLPPPPADDGWCWLFIDFADWFSPMMILLMPLSMLMPMPRHLPILMLLFSLIFWCHADDDVSHYWCFDIFADYWFLFFRLFSLYWWFIDDIITLLMRWWAFADDADYDADDYFLFDDACSRVNNNWYMMPIFTLIWYAIIIDIDDLMTLYADIWCHMLIDMIDDDDADTLYLFWCIFADISWCSAMIFTLYFHRWCRFLLMMLIFSLMMLMMMIIRHSFHWCFHFLDADDSWSIWWWCFRWYAYAIYLLLIIDD